MPEAHVDVDKALPLELPASYLTLVLFWNTQASQTVCPELTVKGAERETICHPSLELTIVDAVTPKRDEGAPDRSEYTPSKTLPVLPL